MKMEDDEVHWCTEAIRFFQEKMTKDRRAELGIRKTKKRASLEDHEDPVPKARTSSVKGGRTKVPTPVPATTSKPARTPPSRPAATPSKTAGASTHRGKPEEVDPEIAAEFLEEDCERVNGGKSLSEHDRQGGDGLCYYFVVFMNTKHYFGLFLHTTYYVI